MLISSLTSAITTQLCPYLTETFKIVYIASSFPAEKQNLSIEIRLIFIANWTIFYPTQNRRQQPLRIAVIRSPPLPIMVPTLFPLTSKRMVMIMSSFSIEGSEIKCNSTLTLLRIVITFLWQKSETVTFTCMNRTLNTDIHYATLCVM